MLIKFIGVGERWEALEPFRPDRLAARILELGDVDTLLERVLQGLPATPPAKVAEERFTFEELSSKSGLCSGWLRSRSCCDCCPVEERSPRPCPWMSVRYAEAIILSMTPKGAAQSQAFECFALPNCARQSNKRSKDESSCGEP